MNAYRSLSTVLALLVSSCTRPVPLGEGHGRGLCADRTGGAEIEIQVNDQTFRLWSTSAAFIHRAKELKDSGQSANAMFDKLLDGTECDSQWTFHVDSSAMTWPDLSIEVCDGRPSDIEKDKPYWFNKVKRWCPWSVKVRDVKERA